MRILDAWLRLMFVPVMLVGCIVLVACGPRDEGSAIAKSRRPCVNSYFFKNTVFPEYKPIIYLVKSYDKRKEAEYFADSLKQAIESYDIAYRQGQMHGLKYIVVVIEEMDRGKSQTAQGEAEKTARIFAITDLFENRGSIDKLVQQTPIAERSIVASRADAMRYGEAGLIIRRHVEQRQQKGEQPVVNLEGSVPGDQQSGPPRIR